MGRASLVGWLWGVALVSFAADQLTKWLTVLMLQPGQEVAVLGSVMALERRANTGAAFSLMQDHPEALTAIGLVVVVGLAVLGPRLAGTSRLALSGLGLVLGGAAGNLLDRLRLGHVVDFIDVHFWPVFNIADVTITVGAILIAIAALTEARTSARRADEEDAASSVEVDEPRS